MPRKKQRASFGIKKKYLKRKKVKENSTEETPSEKKARLDNKAQTMREMRANETPQKTQNRLAQLRNIYRKPLTRAFQRCITCPMKKSYPRVIFQKLPENSGF